MAHIWVVEIWIRDEDGSGYREWRMDFRFTRMHSSQPMNIEEPFSRVAVVWGAGGPPAFTSRALARADAKSTRPLLAEGWKRKDFGVRVARYVRG